MKQQSGVVQTLQPGLVTSPTESRCRSTVTQWFDVVITATWIAKLR